SEVNSLERKVVLASHGKFASGILSSLELICGTSDQVEAIDCYIEEDFDLVETVRNIMEVYSKDELIVITDLFGGSVNNEFLQYIEQPNFYLAAGLNLLFLIELMTKIESHGDISAIIIESLDNAKKSMQLCNESYHKDLEEEDF